MAKKKDDATGGWLIVAVIAALAAAVIGLSARNAKGRKQYDQLVEAIKGLIEEGRARAESAAERLTDTGQDLAQDVQRRAREAREKLS